MQIPSCPKTEEEVSPELCAEMERYVVVPPHVQEPLRRAVREAIQEGADVRT
jgi:hypothetical protein